MSVEAYPLQWPDGWPRTPAHQRESDNRFGGSGKRVTMGRAVVQLMDELRRLGADDIIVSSNIPTKSDGLPYAKSLYEEAKEELNGIWLDGAIRENFKYHDLRNDNGPTIGGVGP